MAPFAVGFCVLLAMTPSGTVHAATFNVTDDLTISGTTGTSGDPDVHVRGYSSFATTPSSAGVVTSNAGSLYIQGSAEFDGSLYPAVGIWKSDGSLGIGTTNPGAKLTVGNNLFQVSSTGDLVKINNLAYTWPASSSDGVLTNNGGGTLSWGAAGGSGAWTLSGSNVYLTTTTDKVGIGLTNPAAKLDIRSAGTGVSGMGFRVSDTLGTDKVVILDNGNVGVGTTAPSEKLHLQDGTLKVDKPANPKLLLRKVTQSSTRGLYISSNYLYVNDLNNFSIYDVANPASPVFVSTVPNINTRVNVIVAGKYAYTSGEASGLAILDVSNASSPFLVSRLQTNRQFMQFDLAGDYAYIPVTDSGLFVVDVSVPSSPRRVGGPATQGSTNWFTSVVARGRYVYGADSSGALGGLLIYDVSNPSSPIQVSRLQISPGGVDTSPNDVAVSGRYAYLSTGGGYSGLVVCDVSNPVSPLLIGWSASLPGNVETQDMSVAGGYAYVTLQGADSGLLIYDISSPTTPVQVARTKITGLPTWSTGICLYGRYLYVSAEDSGLYIYDIGGADVHALTAGTIETSTITVNDNADIGNNLYVRGGINAGPGGIHTDAGLSAGNTSAFWGNVGIGMTNPAYKLDVLGDIRATGNIYGTYAGSVGGWTDGGANVYTGVLTDNVGLGTTAPGALLEIRSAGTGATTMALRIADTAQVMRLAVLDDGNVGIGQTVPLQLLQAGTSPYPGLTVKWDGNVGIGLTNPGAKLDIGGKIRIADGTQQNTYVFTSNAAGAGSWQAAAPGGGGVWNLTGTSSYLNTTTDKVGVGLTNPVAKLDIRTAGTGVSGFGFRVSDTLTNDKVVILDNGNVGVGTTAPSEKFQLQDGTLKVDKPNPRHVGSLVDGAGVDLAAAFAVYVSGRYAYATANGFSILDVSNPASPVQISSIFDTGSMVMAGARNFKVVGRYAYIVGNSDNGLQILDISNPASPVPVGGISSTGAMQSPWKIDVAGRYAYVVGTSPGGVQVIDISVPSSPRLAGSISDSGSVNLSNASAIYVAGRYAYVTAEQSDNALTVLDISNPWSPYQVGSVADNATTALQTADSVVVSGRYAYVTSYEESALEIIDISNPINPTHVGVLRDSAGTALARPEGGLFIAGRYAYVTSNAESGLAIIDISNPASPAHVISLFDSSSTILGGARTVYVSGRYAYIAASNENGIEIIDIGGADVHALTAGTIETGALNVNDNVDIGNNLYVRGGINAGPGGIHTDAGLSAGNTSFFWGNVGVGMTNPAYKLDVLGDIRATGNIYGNVAGSAGGWTKSGTNVYLMNTTAKVGVGITTAAAKLEVRGAGSGSTTMSMRVRNAAGTALMAVTDNGNVGIGQSVPLAMLQVGTSPYPGLIVTAAGNAGIGTTSPYAGARLDVAGTVQIVDGNQAAGRVLTSNAAGVGNWADATGGGSGGGWVRSGASAYLNNTTAKVGVGMTNPLAKLDIRSAGTGVSGMGFRVSDTLGNDKVVILDNGNVGVGTTAPSEKFHLQDGTLAVTAQTMPREVFRWPGTGPDTFDAYVSGRYAYLTGGSDMVILDVADPASPIFVSELQAGSPYTNYIRVHVAGRYAYLASHTPGSGLHIVDVSNPSSPIPAGQLIIRPDIYSLEVSGRYAYCGVSGSGIFTVDISVPSSPRKVGPTYTPVNGVSGTMEDMKVAGRYAYVADQSFGLTVYDVANPTSPTQVGALQPGYFTPLGLAVRGKYAYAVGDDASGLAVVDISNPTAPAMVARVVTTGNPDFRSAELAGNYLYVVARDAYSGLHVFDVTNPRSPVYLGAKSTGNTQLQKHITISGKYAYVGAQGASGVYIYDIGGADVHALTAGTIETGRISVAENAEVGNNLYVRGGINAGITGIHTDAQVSSAGNMKFSGNVGLGITLPKASLEIVSASTSAAFYLNVAAGKLIMRSLDGNCHACGAGDANNNWACVAVTCP